MRHRSSPIVALAGMLLVAGLGLAIVQAQDCEVSDCTYLPAVAKDLSPAQEEATAIPPTPAGPTPIGSNGCEVNPPPPAEGLQAWMSDPNPPPRKQIFVCLRLAVNGRFVTGIDVQAIVHGATTDETYHGRYLGSGGMQPGVQEVQLWPAGWNMPAGGVITVDVAATYLDRIYLAQTSFIAAPEVTDTPTVTPTPTNTPTRTPTSTPTS